MTKSDKPDYLARIKKLSREETERLLSRMGNKLDRRLEKGKLSQQQALAKQLELEDEQLQEWRKVMYSLKLKEESKKAKEEAKETKKVAKKAGKVTAKPKAPAKAKTATKAKVSTKSKAPAKRKTAANEKAPAKIAEKGKTKAKSGK